ncbi:amine oxidase [Chloropicon primus]|uniref:Amine oxidase n=1 Tax=Chloropicon primus TaxID=1764295 RepID=A0A5B8MNI8_9CHLO|nr:amine oxidase [Chloropicon primus]|eukprot:QDZ20890.1 amine oxidase [Chloropicon primus]
MRVATATLPAAKPRAVVVGGGWAGFGAAWNLSKTGGFGVTLVDGSPDPGGVAGKLGESSIELGVKGCWRHYGNIRRLLDNELELPVRDIYNDFSETAFYSKRGLEVVAPVFGELPRLPAPLGTLVYSLNKFTELPINERLTAFPLTQALLEFDLDEESYSAYDSLSFEALCKRAKVSDALYDTFLAPILLALLFVPPKDLSAAAALSVLSNYALSHQSDFDVQWPRVPPSEIFLKWKRLLEESRGAKFLNSTFVRRVLLSDNGKEVRGVEIDDGSGSTRELGAEVVVLAAGANAMPKIVTASGLESIRGLQRVHELSCSAVTATRFEIDGEPMPLRYPSNVWSTGGEVAGTFYDIGALRGGRPGVVLEVDTYNAADLLGLSDGDLESRGREVLSLENSAYGTSSGRVQATARVRNAALRWTPGSHGATPQLSPEGAPRGLLVAGDLVRNGPGDFGSHLGARGLSQEKSLVTGLRAGMVAAEAFLGKDASRLIKPPLHVEPDEPHISAAKAALTKARASGLLPNNLFIH